ncbi:MAG: hypothetical protein H7X95_00245 [Deltaproteobacteria bacterium]|nr:hypothetical protein [Deltaproteobacteria bacterium]
MKNPFVVTLTGLTIVVAAVLVMKWAPPLRQQSAPVATDTAPSGEDFAALTREVASLKQQARAQAMRSEHITSVAAVQAAATPPVTNPAPGKRLTAAEQKKLLSDTLEGQFQGEHPDPAWSPARSSAIKDAVAHSLPGTRTVAVECATTLCRVVVQHDDEDSQSALVDKASEVPDLDTETFFIFDKESTPPRTTMYMARAGKPLHRPRI